MNDDRRCPDCGRFIPSDAPGPLCPVCLLKLGISDFDEEVEAPPQRERNLLFGVFAVQLGLVTKEAFIEAAAGWAVNPEIGLADRFIDAGALSEDDRKLVERLANEAINHHHGDERAALKSIDGEAYSSRIIEELSDAEAHKQLSTVLGLPAFVSTTDTDEIRAVDEGAGRYTTRGEHSRGGMGRILVVHDEFLDRDIALKELLPQDFLSKGHVPGSSGPLRASGAMIARFLREAQVTGQLEHPSIVPVYELGRRPDGTLYYTMKLVRGRTFSEALKEATSLTDRLALLSNFVDLCYAVGYAHSRGVVHRDLKPANVMLGTFGETVVIDWGIAKITGQEDDYEKRLRETITALREGAEGKGVDLAQTSTGQRIGTPAYMAPEQVDGRVKDIDQRTNVFALGIILYEILAGTHPFVGKTSAEIMSSVLAGKPKSIDAIEPQAPPELVSICRKAMQKRSEDRFQSAEDLAAEIERFQTGALVRSYEYSLVETLKHHYAKHRPLVNVAAVAILIGLLGGIYSYVSVRTARDEAVVARDDAQREAYRAQIRLATAQIEENNHDAARQTLWKTEPGLRSWEWSRLLDQAYQERYAIGGYDAFVVSGDEQVAAAYYRDSDILLFDPADGTERLRIPVEEGLNVSELAVNDNGSFLAGRMAGIIINPKIRLWSVETGNLIRELTVGAESIAFDPSGTRLLTGDKNGSVRIWNAETGEEVASFEALQESVGRVRFNGDGSRVIAKSSEATAVWDASTTDLVTRIETERADVSSDGSLAAVFDDSQVEIRNLSTGSSAMSLSAHPGGVRSVQFSEQGGRLLTVGSYDNSVAIWSLQTGDELVSIRHRGPVLDAFLSSDGALVVSTTLDARVWVWSSASGELVNELGGHAAPIRQIEILGDNSTLLTGAFDRTVRAWPARTPSGQQIVASHPSGIRTGIAFHEPTGRVAAYATHGVAGIFNLESREPLIELTTAGFLSELFASFHPDGDRLALVLDDFLPMVVDCMSGELLSSFQGHEGLVTSIAFAPSGNEVASGSRDGRVYVWDSATGTERLRFEAHEHSVYELAFSPDGAYVASGDNSGVVIVWRTSNGQELTRLSEATDTVTSLRWTADANELLITSKDNSVSVWAPLDDGGAYTLNGHQRPPAFAASLANSQRLVTGSSTSLRVWDRLERTELVAFTGRSQLASNFLFSASRDKYVVHATDGTVQVWDVFPWQQTEAGSAGEARFEAYRESRATTSGHYAIDSSEVLVVFAHTDQIVASCDRLIEAIQAVEPTTLDFDEDGLMIVDGPMRNAVARIGIHAGDRIRTINDGPLRDQGEAVSTLQSAVTALQNGSTLNMEMLRSGFEKEIRFVQVPHTTETIVVQLSPNDGVDLLNALRRGLDLRGEGVAEPSRIKAQELGELNGDGTLAGVWLGPSPIPEDRARFAASRISPYDRIMRVNNAPVESVEGLSDIANDIINGIRSGDADSFTVVVERGNFTTRTVQFEIQR